MKKKKNDDSMLRGSTLERMALSEWMNVVSGNECTGLMPSLPIDFEEAEAYSEIYDVPVSKSQGETTHSDDKKR